MKTRIFILLTAMAFSLTTNALAQNFSTGSDMMNTGSSLSSNVYGVGATGVDPMAGTTNYSNNSQIRRIGGGGGMGQGDDPGQAADGSPIGAPYIMLLFAAGAAGVVAMRRRKA